MGALKREIVICVDFDGTVVTHDYPKIGKDIGALPVLKKLVNNGHKLILYTMRNGKELEEAVQWYKDNDIELYGINTNPTQRTWTDSPKAYCNLVIDDIGLFIPLIYDLNISNRPFVNWTQVEQELIRLGLID
jgi:hypothetical protein